MQTLPPTNRMDRGWEGLAVDKLFLVELSGGNIRHCELELPATDYELLDALDKLRLSEAAFSAARDLSI